MKIAVIDNYDSFIQTIIYYLKSIATDIEVFVMKNDAVDFFVIDSCDLILLSPGPGIPSEAGEMLEVIKRYHQQKPILGVCLGHQALYEYFGGTLKNIKPPLHGVSSKLKLEKTHFLWEDLQEPIEVAHYHSWVANTTEVPTQLEILAYDENENVMAIAHKEFPILGIQFHPESILTPQGKMMFENWIKRVSKK